jgi:hypothetical protein
MNADTGFETNGVDLAKYHPKIICLFERVHGSRTEETVTFSFDSNVDTTDYAVFPSFYYGYTGSSGTYSAMNTSNAIHYEPIVDERTTSGFKIKFKRTNGDNLNIFLTALVVFDSSFNYPPRYDNNGNPA